jgi:peptide/nickel transport system permease protein
LFPYICKRLGMALPTVISVSVLVFLMIRAIPGDPVALMMGDINDPALVEHMRVSMGLDQPIWVQYEHWILRALQGDLGISTARHEPVLSLVLKAFPVTAQIVVAATLLGCLVAIPAGMFAAWQQNRAGDAVVVSMATLLVSAPSFWVGILLLWLFGVHFDLLPTYGFSSIRESGISAVKFLILPVVAIVLTEMASITRMVRASAIDVLRLEYISHARAKGLKEARVLMSHALPNAFGSALTVIGLVLGHLLSGAAVIETVFTLPGLGRLLVESIYSRDYPVVQGCLLFISLLYILTNLMIDLLYPFFDPRIKLN